MGDLKFLQTLSYTIKCKIYFYSSSTVLSTEPAVSTEGLGSNTSDMSSLDEYSYRPKFASYLGRKTLFIFRIQLSVNESLQHIKLA